MSRGLGWVQRACLRIIGEHEAAGNSPETFNIAAEVYQIARDKDGNRWLTDAQHAAVKRALAELRRQGCIVSKRGFTDGRARWHTRAEPSQEALHCFYCRKPICGHALAMLFDGKPGYVCDECLITALRGLAPPQA